MPGHLTQSHKSGKGARADMAEVLRFGLIGCGGQGRYLSEALRMTGRAAFAACADIKLEAAEKAAERCGYDKAYADYERMLGEVELDAVIVATTHDQLHPAAMAAVAAGKHVFVEKPMALNAADGRELVHAARDADVKLMVGYTLRFMPDRILMKKLLGQGAIGDLSHVMAGQLIGGMGGWLGERARGGGPVFYIGSHIIDNVLWMVDSPVQRVFAEVDWTEEGGVEAGVQLTIVFASGAMAQVCTSQKLGGRYGWIDLMGSGGRMRAEWESHDLFIQSTSIEAYSHPTTIALPSDAYLPPAPPDAEARVSGAKYVKMWMAEFHDFICAIAEDRDPAVTGEDAVRLLEVTDAVWQSAQTGAPVDVGVG